MASKSRRRIAISGGSGSAVAEVSGGWQHPGRDQSAVRMTVQGVAEAMECTVRAVRALFRLRPGILSGRGKRTALRFVFTTLMGGCMGSMGTAIAEVSTYQPWADVLSGALGASGAFGLEMIIRRMMG